MSWRSAAHLLSLVALIAGAALPAFAAGASLASLVPADAGLCLLVDEAAPHVDRFLAGPLSARWQTFPPLRDWSDKNRPGLAQISAEVARQLGVEPEDVWRQIFGHRVVVAVWPKPDPAQREGPGLLLVEARDARLLARLVDGLCEAQLRAGEVVESREASHAGANYRARVIQRASVESKVCLAVLGNIGVLTSDENVMRRVLDLHAARPDARLGLAESPLFREALGYIDAAAPVKLFVNSRVWDSTILADSSQGGVADKPDARLLLDVWRASRLWAFSLRLDPRLTLLGNVQFDPLPDSSPVQRGLASMSGPANFAQRVPADCLAAVAGSVDIGRLLHLARGATGAADGSPSLPPAPGQRRGPLGVLAIVWSLLDETFQGLGPSLGAYVVASPESNDRAASQRQVPADVVLGIGVNNRRAAERPTPRSGDSHAGLQNLLQLAVALAGQQPGKAAPQIQTSEVDKLQINEFTGLGDLPQGWQPTFTIAHDVLLAATSRGAIERCARLSADESLAVRTLAAARLELAASDPSHLLYVNLAATRAWLSANRGRLSPLLAAKRSEPELLDRGLDQLLSVLGLADNLVVTAKIRTSHVAVCISLSADDNGKQPPSR